MNRHLLKYILALPILFFSVQTLAQNEIVHVWGQLKDEGTKKKLENAQVQVFKDGSQFDVYDAGTSGKYDFKLPLGYTYDIKFSRADYLSKVIRIDTRNIPEEERYGGFDMNIDGTLFPYREGFNTDILKDPLAMAKYNAQGDGLEFDFQYSENKQKMIQAEFKRLDDLEKDKEKMLAKFNELVEKGDQNMIQEKFEDAMGNYKEALAIFPKDEPVKAKYADAKAKFDAANADKDLVARHKKLVEEADKLFKGDKFGDAKSKYQEAIKLKPTDNYSKEQVYQCDLGLAEAGKRAGYDAIVADADKKFNNTDYAVSIEKYREASAIYPNESYPKDQIIRAEQALKNLLAGEAEKQRIQKEYDDKIALAQRNFSEEKYEQALDNYRAASMLKPEEKMPPEKIKEIEDLMADLAAKGLADAALADANAEKERLEKEFNDLIAKADELFSREQWLESKEKYEASLIIKPEAEYPKSRIERIDMELARMGEDLVKLRQKAIADSIAAAKLAMMDEHTRKKIELIKQREEDRQHRMEVLEEQRIAAAQKVIDNKREHSWSSNADEEAEDEVETFYRNAKKQEDAARAMDINKKHDENKSFYEKAGKKFNARLTQREELIQSRKEGLTEMQETGESWQTRSAAENEKKKKDINKDKDEYKQRADGRMRDAQDKVETQKEAQSSLSQNDRNRQVRVGEMNDAKERQERQSDGYRKKGDAQITANKLDSERKKEDQQDMAYEGEEVRKENTDKIYDKIEEEKARDDDERKAAGERISNSAVMIDDKKEAAQSIGDGKEAITEKRANDIEDKKQAIELENIKRDNKSANDRFDARNEAFSKKAGEPKSEDDYLQVPGSENLPEGVSENSYKEGNKMVTERTVKVGNKVDHYKKVVSKTAIYYFKNGKSISEVTWKQETLKSNR